MRVNRAKHIMKAAAVVALVPALAQIAPPEPVDRLRLERVAAVGAPLEPPVRVCGNAAVLDGPTTAPAGAVIVNPGQNLNDATQARPAGTTFYLTAGAHVLSDNVYDQVIAKTGNVYIGAPGAALDGRGVNRTAFSGVAPNDAVNVTVKHLTVKNFVALQDQAVANPSAAAGWRFERNTFTANKGAPIFLGTDSVIAYNCLDANGQYGISSYKPITNVVVDHNEISRNNTDDWERVRPGCGCSGGVKFWDVTGARVTNNWVHHNKSAGLWADTNNIGFTIEGNYINDNDAQAIFYEISYNARIANNRIKRNTLKTGRDFEARGDSFPIGTIYVAESGGDARVNGGAYSTLEITGNVFEDNWGGVVLWEAADRFCGSAANTSAGYCTKVNPRATLDTCQSDAVNNEPYYSDCRWKTQNVSVSGNTFALDKTAIACTTTYCGRQGLISNYGVTPPYLGAVVSERITFNSANVWRSNNYTGDWRFSVYDPSRLVDWATWQAAPYSQDVGSTYNGSSPTSTTTTTAPPPPTTTTTTAPTTTTTAPTTTTTAPTTTTTTAPTTTTTAPTTTTTTAPTTTTTAPTCHKRRGNCPRRTTAVRQARQRSKAKALRSRALRSRRVAPPATTEARQRRTRPSASGLTRRTYRG